MGADRACVADRDARSAFNGARRTRSRRGHTPAEWLMRGLPYPSLAERVGRMIELVDTARRLLLREEVTFAGTHIGLWRARLDSPREHQHPRRADADRRSC
jgi:hypothetical protein